MENDVCERLDCVGGATLPPRLYTMSDRPLDQNYTDKCDSDHCQNRAEWSGTMAKSRMVDITLTFVDRCHEDAKKLQYGEYKYYPYQKIDWDNMKVTIINR